MKPNTLIILMLIQIKVQYCINL